MFVNRNMELIPFDIFKSSFLNEHINISKGIINKINVSVTEMCSNFKFSKIQFFVKYFLTDIILNTFEIFVVINFSNRNFCQCLKCDRKSI